MKKRIAFLSVLVAILLAVTGAFALTEAEFNQSCWVKIGTSTTLYQRSDSITTATDLGDSLVADGTIAAGTYVRITETNGSYDKITYYNGTGYVLASSVVSATATVALGDGSTVEIPEAMAGNTSAIVAYLRDSYPNNTYTVDSNGVIQVNGSTGTNTSTDDTNDNTSTGTTKAPTVLAAPLVTYTDENGQATTVQLKQLALAYSVIELNGNTVTVPTYRLSWETEATAKKVIATVKGSSYRDVALVDSTKKGAVTIETLHSGTVVAVMKTGKTYTRVYVNGHVGFIKTSRLVFSANTERENAFFGYIAYNGNVNSNNEINVRAAGKNGTRIVEVLPSGTFITVLKSGKTWTEIEAGNLHGYVLTKFVIPAEEGDPNTVVYGVTTTAPDASSGETVTDFTVGDDGSVVYGAYEMNQDYANGADYEDEERYFFDEEY